MCMPDRCTFNSGNGSPVDSGAAAAELGGGAEAEDDDEAPAGARATDALLTGAGAEAVFAGDDSTGVAGEACLTTGHSERPDPGAQPMKTGIKAPNNAETEDHIPPP